jgi:hypothetical protein
LTAPRVRIGRYNDLATRQIVYQTEEAIEVDEIDHFQIVRKRVFFDDILFVTLHRQFGAAFLVTMATLAAILLLVTAILVSEHQPEFGLGFGAAASPFIVAFFVRLVLRQDVVTVYGRRSKAAMRFTFRKAFARAKFEEITSLGRRAQARIAAQQRAGERHTAERELPSDVPLPPAETQSADEPPAEPDV